MGTVIRRLLVLVPTAIVATMLVFALQLITPGGPAEAAAGPNATAQQIAAIRSEMGMNAPIPVQYGTWLWNLVHGDFGQSLLNHQDVGTEIGQRLPVTLEETILGLLLGLVVGIPLGVLAAARRQGRFDAVVRGISGLGVALPPFVLGVALAYLFGLKLRWLPPTGFTPLTQDVGANLQGMILPMLVLGIGVMVGVIRQTRSSMLEVLDSPYIRTAWALGLPRNQIYFRFALKNALITVITLVGLIAGITLGAAVIVEQIFVIPGMGSMLINAVGQKDFPVTQGVVVIFVALVLFINLAVDLSYAALDPRVRSS